MPRWAIDIDAGTGGFEAATKRITAATNKAAKQSSVSWKGVAGGLTAATAAATGLGAAFFGLSQRNADLVNDINDASTRSGVAADTLNGLRLAAEGSGLAFSDMLTVTDKLPRKLADADAGMVSAIRGFENLGVASHDATGNLRSADDVLKDSLQALSAIKEPTERAARAVDVFGRSGAKLLQALGDTRALDTFTRAAERGASVSGQAAEEAAAWQREIALLRTEISGAGSDITEAFGGGATVVKFLGANLAWLRGAAKEYIGRTIDDIKDIGVAWNALMNIRDPTKFLNVIDNLGYQMADAVNPTEALSLAIEAGKDEMTDYLALSDEIFRLGSMPGAGLGDQVARDSKALAESTRLLADARRIGQGAVEDLFSAEAKLLSAYHAQQDALDAIMADEKASDEAMIAATEAGIALKARYYRDLEALRLEDAKREDELEEEAMQKYRERLAEQARLDRELSQARVTNAANAAGAISSIGTMIANEGRSGAMGAWRVSQGAAIAEAGLNTLLAVSNAFADVPFPANFGAAIVAGAVGAANAAAIASAKPPSFYTGLSYPAVLHKDERVLNKTGAATMGDNAIAQANRGERPGGDRETILQVDGRDLAYSISRQIVQGGSLSAQLTRKTGRLGHWSATNGN